MSFWNGKKVLVTGGAGFIGSHVVEFLVKKGAKVRIADYPGSKNSRNLSRVKEKIEFVSCDLLNFKDCLKVTKGIDVTMNLAAIVGGIEFNIKNPASIFRANMIISINMLEAARINNNDRLLVVSSACVYPRHCKVPTPESDGFLGLPEPTNDGYGWAKRMAEFQAVTYNRQYGLKVAIARPYNTYGPRDCFKPDKSHVIPALIKRICDKENPLIVWGGGEQSRAFIYVSDTARGLIEVVEKHPFPEPLNIGTDEEVKIKDLVQMIMEISGIETNVIFDASKPAGQPRRNSDNTKIFNRIGFKAKVNLREGLRKTITWYKNNERRIK